MVNKSDIFRKKAPEWIINKKIICNDKYIQNLLFQTKTNMSFATTCTLSLLTWSRRAALTAWTCPGINVMLQFNAVTSGGSGLLRNGSGSACVRRTVAGRISRVLESYKADDSDGCLTCGLSPHIINITCKLSLLKHPHIIMHQRTRLSVSSLLVAPLGCITPSQICTLLWGGWCEYDQFPGYFTIS